MTWQKKVVLGSYLLNIINLVITGLLWAVGEGIKEVVQGFFYTGIALFAVTSLLYIIRRFINSKMVNTAIIETNNITGTGLVLECGKTQPTIYSFEPSTFPHDRPSARSSNQRLTIGSPRLAGENSVVTAPSPGSVPMVNRNSSSQAFFAPITSSGSLEPLVNFPPVLSSESLNEQPLPAKPNLPFLHLEHEDTTDIADLPMAVNRDPPSQASSATPAQSLLVFSSPPSSSRGLSASPVPEGSPMARLRALDPVISGCSLPSSPM